MSSECLPHQVPRGSPAAAESPPSRATERLPPLLTWPNFDFWKTSSEKERRRAIGDYYACATHVDGTIGALLGALGALSLDTTTAVVLHGDHGYSLGRHGRWSKYNLYEDATRVLLILSVPGVAPAVVDDVVESLDVLPTILDLWGVRRRVDGVADDEGYQQLAASAAAKSANSGRWPPTVPPALPPPLSPAAWLSPPLHYDLRGVAVTVEGEALLPLRRRRRRYARSELHLPCGVSCCMLNQPYDGKPPGFSKTPTVGPVVQLYVRTARFAYTAVFLGVLPAAAAAAAAAATRTSALRGVDKAPAALGLIDEIGSRSGRDPITPLRLIDEMLFDTDADPDEKDNLAYYNNGPHARMRGRLLATVLRDWNVTLQEGQLNESRWQRAEELRVMTGYRRDWWKDRKCADVPCNWPVPSPSQSKLLWFIGR